MRKKIDKKELILKKIQHRHDKNLYIEKKNNMNERNRRRIFGDKSKPIPILKNEQPNPFLRNKRREGIRIQKEFRGEIKNDVVVNLMPTPYQKKAFVDFDVVICIPSYNRYEKVERIISQLYNEPTKYTFKLVLLNDGSDDERYDNLLNIYPNIHYIKNEKPNGKVLHWYCYNQMWEILKEVKCHAVLQMDDDFILSKDFLNVLTDLFFNKKEKNSNIMAIAPHLWSFNETSEFESWWSNKHFVDGIALIDIDVIEFMEYKMLEVNADEVCKAGVPVRAWTQIGDAIGYLNNEIYRTENSLVYHDGNGDSKLHGDVRIDGQGGVYTQKYIGKLW